jgi:hypothetical protein
MPTFGADQLIVKARLGPSAPRAGPQPGSSQGMAGRSPGARPLRRRSEMRSVYGRQRRRTKPSSRNGGAEGPAPSRSITPIAASLQAKKEPRPIAGSAIAGHREASRYRLEYFRSYAVPLNDFAIKISTAKCATYRLARDCADHEDWNKRELVGHLKHNKNGSKWK